MEPSCAARGPYQRFGIHHRWVVARLCRRARGRGALPLPAQRGGVPRRLQALCVGRVEPAHPRRFACDGGGVHPRGGGQRGLQRRRGVSGALLLPLGPGGVSRRRRAVCGGHVELPHSSDPHRHGPGGHPCGRHARHQRRRGRQRALLIPPRNLLVARGRHAVRRRHRQQLHPERGSGFRPDAHHRGQPGERLEGRARAERELHPPHERGGQLGRQHALRG
mmetsp:Transcript_39464/g.75615  ORF Transcript_39464/g.75615 Transcript_39464/m.75615 type:complete len:221 (-) Transcript_39464:1879-2541(-)